LHAINYNPMLRGSLLVRNVTAISQRSLPDASYVIEHGIVGPKVAFFSTRWGSQWVTYDAVCWHDRASHYAVSSPMEMFAEMYTKKFTGGGGLPRPNNGQDPGRFFHALEQADPVQLGLPANSPNAQPASGAPRPGAGGPTAASTSGAQGPSAPPPGKAIPLS
jgi:hypothetical protein